MFVVIYRWRLKPAREPAFTAAWGDATRLFREEHGALGSRLHRADDGTHFAYAQWPSREAYHAHRTLSARHRDLLARMADCVLTNLPTEVGEVTSDLLAPP